MRSLRSFRAIVRPDRPRRPRARPIDLGTRLAQVLHDSLDPTCDGGGCDSGTDDRD